MAENEKGIDLVRAINREWRSELEKDTSLGILMYEPFTGKYWTEKYKIVLCNLEPGGDKPQNKNILDLECFDYWLGKNKRTIKNSAIFLYCLYNMLYGKDIDKNNLEAVKNNKKLLLDNMENVTYMNLLQDVGEGRFDRKYFWDFYAKDNIQNRNNLFNLINALDPDIFIVTSEGDTLIEQLFQKRFENHIFIYNKKLFVKLGHPSLYNIHYILNNAKLIKENLISNNLFK